MAALTTKSTKLLLSKPLSPSDTQLLSHLHSLIITYHQSNPPSSSSLPPSPSFLSPSLSSSFSSLLPSPPSPSLVHSLIHLLSLPNHSPPFLPTLSFFNWYLSIHPPSSHPSPLPFLPMLDFAAKLRHFHISWHFLDLLHSHSIPIPLSAFSSLIRRYIRASLPDAAISAFLRIPSYNLQPTPSTFSLLISFLSKGRFASHAQSLFDSLKHKFPPDVVLYSNLVHAWCRAGRIDEAERVFREMKDNGINPNVYTFTSIIDAMCRAGQIPRAQELLCQMIDDGCSPNTATFNSFMRAHVKAGRTEQVLQVHNQMKQLGCEPDVITYNFLIETHCRKRQRNLDAAIKVLNQMIAKGCAPDAHTFNHVFKCVLELGDVNAAHKLYTKMREVKCEPNTVTYNLLMGLFSKAKSMDMVLRMKKEMEEEGVEANVNTYGVLISAFCERGHWKRAYGLMKEMVEQKCLKPSGPTREMVFGLLRNAGQLTKHEELVEKMVERGFISRYL
ncbi:pentatricopeptide repeat-containing protein At1g20300, mitochondrial [Dioscorea cayenensis subsp. rotundata]|uniref:Pentatricopeptide repeat-containing protein At1g20300, mitochondrial n=1 Tax=Dioscorea cayennensis subsp. rotundata TaxID=55577 RepID=A0AB40BKM1_DIOCR|nr:pentatricopeptide repeat-containing protein At1g20300, mitochondrial [Dioscorea cayenensis subsp. rotundata]